MQKSFKYRIYASDEVLTKTESWLEHCRELYNSALSERISAYRYQRVSLSGYTQMLELPDIKNEFPEYFLEKKDFGDLHSDWLNFSNNNT